MVPLLNKIEKMYYALKKEFSSQESVTDKDILNSEYSYLTIAILSIAILSRILPKYYLLKTKINPNNAEAHIKLGNAYRILEQYEKELHSYIRAIEIKMKNNNISVTGDYIINTFGVLKKSPNQINIEAEKKYTYQNIGNLLKDIISTLPMNPRDKDILKKLKKEKEIKTDKEWNVLSNYHITGDVKTNTSKRAQLTEQGRENLKKDPYGEILRELFCNLDRVKKKNY